MQADAIVASGLHKSYTTGRVVTPVLRDLSLVLSTGELCLIVGPSGCGKSTLLALLSGLLRPDRGSVRACGSELGRLDVAALDRFRLQHTGFVFQGFNLFPALTALEQVAVPLGYLGLRRDAAYARAAAALDEVGLAARRGARPAELSGGEKQRLSLARMTRAQFDLLCLDEPTNHLDVAGTEGLEQALKEFPGTVVLITHDRQLVESVADRVAWVEGGAIRTFDQGLEQCQRVLAEERAAARAAEAAERDRAARTAPPADEPKRAIETGKVRNPLLFQRLEERIMALEADVEATRAKMLEPDNYASASRMKELQATEVRLKAELATAYEQWENWQ